MARIPIADVRLRMYLALLPLCFLGHVLQIVSEDEPWAEWAWARSFVNAGWHLLMPTWVPWALAAGLGLAVLALAWRRDRATFIALAVLYLLHYVTYPWRIRNHMTTMLGGLGVVTLVWLVARSRGALVVGASRARTVDAAAVRGLALVIAVQYVFAGLHKINDGFLNPAIDGGSSAIGGLTELWIHADLGSVPPAWARYVATYGTVLIEIGAPLTALLVPRLAPFVIAVLMAFHFPHVAVMNVADYPMIACAFYPALLSLHDAHRFVRHLGPSRWTVAGAILGAGAQLWCMPYWGGLMALGIVVIALWGWALGAMLRAWWTERALNPPPARSPASAAP